MKGKVAFVFGATVGYVLGTRAGRARYEQIKRGAKSLWGTPQVQRVVSELRGVTQVQLDRAKAAALEAGKNFIGGTKRESSSTASARVSDPGGAGNSAGYSSQAGAES